MKRTVVFLTFLLCLALVLYSGPAMEAARTALSLWWEILLPTLFPFFASATLMERTGALQLLANAFYPLSKRLRVSCYALPLLLLGGVSGYPSGARLCGMLQANRDVSDEEAERLGTACNLCSPMFLMGAVAGGMFKNTRLFLPLAAAYYGSALLIALLLHLFWPIRPSLPRRAKPLQEPLYRVLPRSIGDGMADMLKVGGSVVFFLVFAEVLRRIGLMGALSAPLDRLLGGSLSASPGEGILLGLLEMTGGCSLISQAGLPVLISVPLCAFLTGFGGMSVLVQAMAFVQFRKPLRYLGVKLAHGLLAAGIAWAILRAFPGSAEAFSAQLSPYAVNALTGLALLFASALGVAAAAFLALLFGKNERGHSSI